MDNLGDLLKISAYSLKAQTIYPSSTLPAHASMLSGMCPTKHGVTWNAYLPKNGYAKGDDLFDLAHTAGLRTLMIVGKQKLRQVSEPESTDVFEFINDRDTVIAQTFIELFSSEFGLLFVHFPTTDAMGHEYGWLSPEQLSVLYRADEALAVILEALDQAGKRQDTLLIITADHGGHDIFHGSRRPEDMTIPWIISGPGVKPGPLITSINITDTAATAAWAMDLPLPAEWDGLPVLEAFGLPDIPHPEPRCP
jgi:predicted AlkP superfamily pyrophosphatase or phosphodiesterase